jgi:hypothetical protein
MSRRIFRLIIGSAMIAAAANLPVSTWAQVSTTFEPNTDRFGSDYFGFDLPGPQPSLCQQACIGDANCRAWTYVNPGIQGPRARCYLKNPAPPPQASNCCVSGAKMDQSTPPPEPPPGPLPEPPPGPLPEPPPSPPVPSQGTTCDDFWVARNSIYKARGYCFKTPRAINYFGNAGCIYQNENDVPLTQADRAQIAQIQTQERAMGCN